MITTVKCVQLADGTEWELPFADLLPSLSEDEYAALREDIRKNGIQYPIILDDNDRVVDGQHRLLIAKEIGLTGVPSQYLMECGFEGDDYERYIRESAIGLNIHRRQIDRETRARLVAILKEGGLSNRAIAEQVGVDERTVRRDLAQCSGAANAAPEQPPADKSERRERVKAAKQEGKTHREIAATEGVSVGTVAADLAAPPEARKEPTPSPVEPLEPEPPKAVTKPRAPETKAEKPELTLDRIDPDHWRVRDSEDNIVGLIDRGTPESHTGFTAHVLLPDGEYTVREFPLSYWGGAYYPSMKEAMKDMAEALADKDGFIRRQENRYHHVNKLPRPKYPKEPFHDLPLEDDAWREHEDLLTDSLWLLGARAKGQGRSGTYHGNFVPQVPDQILRRYTEKGDVVLDPFAGGGTTLVEAARLGRHSISYDLSVDAVKAIQKLRDSLNVTKEIHAIVRWGDCSQALLFDDVRQLLDERFGGRGHVDHVFLHPPYWDIIQFSKHETSTCLSRCPDLRTFLEKFERVAWRSLKLLKPGKCCTLVIGDVWKDGRLLPLGFRLMNRIIGLGLVDLLAINVKDIQGNEKGATGKQAGLARYRALKNGNSVFKHEYVMVFRRLAE